MRRIYIASAYGRRHGKSEEECEQNTIRAIEVGRQLIMRGFNPLIPHLWHYIAKGWRHDIKDEDLWYSLVSEWVQCCDALFVADYPSWENSGVQAEIELAESLGKPVYWSLEAIK